MAKTSVKDNGKVTEKNKTFFKVLKIIIAVILVIAIVSAVFIEITIAPKKDTDENAIYVGGMIYSDTVEYQCESAIGIKNNPIIKVMEMVWRFCDSGDKSKHAKQTPPDNVTEISDIPYIDDGNHYHLLDVFYPDNLQQGEKLPVIIDIHGGGWMYADKDLNDYYCMSLASRGYVVFNISYRLVPDVTVNEQIQDVICALNWICENIGAYPCDESNIMLTGDSAGGQLAAYASVIMQSDELRKVFNTVDVDMELTALLLTSPVAYMKDGGLFSVYTKILWGNDYKSKATYDYMDLDEIIDYANNMPPVYLITSSGDSLANSQTHRAYDLLQERNIESYIADYGEEYGSKLPHVFSVLYPFDEAGSDAIDKALEFYQNSINS